jgi:hypothetical protein
MKNLIHKDEKDQIDSICNEYKIKNYTINYDGTIDVDGNVLLSYKGLSALPLRFNNVFGNFKCDQNNLTSLEGSPKYVGGAFTCASNHLTSLAGGPNKIEDDFCCYFNSLPDLVGGPSYVGGDYVAYSNDLHSFEGCAEIINGDFEVSNNHKLITTMSGDTDIELKGKLRTSRKCKIPNEILSGEPDAISIILKYQRHFFIWNADLTLNIENFKDLMSEIEDGLQ